MSNQVCIYKVMSRGGKRVGSGRPHGDRTVSITVRVSHSAAQYLAGQPNKSEFIDRLIKDAECREILLGKPL